MASGIEQCQAENVLVEVVAVEAEIAVHGEGQRRRRRGRRLKIDSERGVGRQRPGRPGIDGSSVGRCGDEEHRRKRRDNGEACHGEANPIRIDFPTLGRKELVSVIEI